MKYEYKTDATYRGYGWIEPLMDSEDSLIEDYVAIRICEELNNLQAENERLRKDAERYQCLRRGNVDDIAVVRGLGAMDYGMSAVIDTYSEEIDGDVLDATIDEAMGKENNHE